jgi:uncharacterized protein (DUF2267 family)
MDIWNIIIPAITAVLGYIIGSFKPIIDWQIEKRKLKRESRKLFIKEVRDYFKTNKSFNRVAFAETVIYINLKRHLSKKLIEEIEDPFVNTINVIVTGDLTKIKTPVPELMKELRDLEEKWELI